MTNSPKAAESIHIIIAATGTLGDMYPFIGLGIALRGRGHRITVLAPVIHADLVHAAGLAFHPLGSREGYLALVQDPALWDSRRAFATLWRGMLSNLREIPAFIDELPNDERCLLLAHPLVLPAAALAQAGRPTLPIVGAYVAPANMRTVHDPLTIGPLSIPKWLPKSWCRWVWTRIDAKLIDPIAVPDLNAERHRRGLTPVVHLIEHMHAVADLSLTLFPPWFAKDQPDWPQPRHSGEFPFYDPKRDQALSTELQSFLAEGDAPIIFTPGTGQQHASHYFAQALDALTRIGRRAIFLTPFPGQLPSPLPRTVLWQTYVPLRSLLTQVAAIVHHGGVGTTAEALRAGTPQVVVPLAHDQFDNGARVEALGVGRTIKATRASGRALASILAALLSSNTVRAQCNAMAKRLAQPPNMAAVCAAIEGALPDKSR